MQQNLMTSRRFAPLFWTQFLSAFNDNFLKNTLVFLILATVAAYLIGMAIRPEDIAGFPHLRMANGETDTGVIVTYNSEALLAAHRRGQSGANRYNRGP